MFNLKFTEETLKQLSKMKKQGLKTKLKKIKTTLDYLKENPRHPGLHTHKYQSLKTLDNREVFQSYVENKTSAAYRVFWHYGPDKKDITIITVVQHP